jgi:two-component system chemotaxis sensor kinase CheA
VHLVRNAVDHGLERAPDRQRLGKPIRGRLVITFAQSESSVRATVADDGAGIDFARLREVLAERGVDADQATEQELSQMLFDHGVSTRETADEISGRGIGLDVVSKELSEIGGHVTVESVPGRGTKFTLEMPATMKADVVVPVRTRSVHAAVPARAVLRVTRVARIEGTGRGPVIRIARDHDDDEPTLVPLFSLQALLEGTGEPQIGDVVVVVQGSREPFALTVLGFQNPRPVTFKRTQELAVRSRLVRGMSLQADGSVLLLLDVEALGAATAEPGLARPMAANGGEPSRPAVEPRVLVVEDAPVARELLVGVLRSFGLRVEEAVDGRDGLERALDDPPDMILTDIEMPYIDGLSMIRRLRDDPRMAEVPIVVLTTRTDAETRAQARALGVVRFLSKQRFVEEELRGVVAACLGWQ